MVVVANFKKHFWYYICFGIMQLIGLALVVFTAAHKQVQLMAIFATTAVYVFWAILHHYVHHDLTAKIVVEYILVGTLGLMVSLFLFSV